MNKKHSENIKLHPENLVSLADRSPEERKTIAAMGGKKAGELAKRRKALREDLEYLLSLGDTQEQICLALIREAVSGNRSGSVTKAFEVIRDTLGEKPTEKLSVCDDNEIKFTLTVVDSDGKETKLDNYAG